MKRALSVFLAVLLLAAAAGCSEKDVAVVGEAPNEILTYRRLDPAKTTLIVSHTGNIYIDDFSAEFEARNPDVQVVNLDITGGGVDAYPMEDWLKNGLAPDVMFWSGSLVSNDVVGEYFTNLSTSAVVSGYQSEALNDVAIDANIYCLPCPSEVQCMIYNKTLFEQYGWETPTSFDEFVALCDQITADTGGAVEPWNPNAKYSNEFQTSMEGFLYEELFGGADNRAWYDAAKEGGAADVAGHLAPMYDAVQTLIDHGILRSEHFTYSATERGKEFQAGKIAMINSKATAYSSADYQFGLMPFPSTSGALGYVCKTYSAVVGVPLKERSDTVQDAVDRYLAFFSSPEGQQIFIGDSLEISNVKGVDVPVSSALASLQPTLDEGHRFSLLFFDGDSGRINFSITNDAKAMASGEATKAECLAAIEADPYQAYESAEEKAAPETVAAVDRDFTILETSFYIADMYREATGADVGLIANNIACRGNLMRIFAGELNVADVAVLKPRSLANGSTLVKAAMTGQQLLDALNDPVGADDKTGDCIYAFSGLQCEVAPWNAQGERYVSVTLADGADVDPERLYTVAFWSGTVFDKYITGTPEVCDGTWEDLMTAKLRSGGAIAPADDGRITLVWE
ncbi:MAG: extracellular solute-binding protein [Oscillospiraceae bacterium]|nr:extracellular solute-binding protein [Oscillospiraceae bacterium]